MLSIKYSDIPTYLHCSEFYLSLDSEDRDEEIEIPIRCFKRSPEVTNFEDFRQILRVIQFWGINSIPINLVIFCTAQGTVAWRGEAQDILGSSSELLSELYNLCHLSHSAALLYAVKIERVEAVEYIIHNYPSWNLFSGTASCTAAWLGNLEILKLLHENNCQWDSRTCEKASLGGH